VVAVVLAKGAAHFVVALRVADLGRAVKAVMSMMTVHFKVLMRLMSTTAALTGSMLFASFMNNMRTSTGINFRWRFIFVNMTMHWRFYSATLFVGSPLHAVHGVLLNHMMNVTAVGVVFTMHFVMFSHNLPLMLV
jgi:hypothetical protein